ncbi:MAG: hypothetical protein J3K34DRAFT_280505 [Monoraphidium minutum]|nr:MAG: hypothetical protein J3K34DRAFT_280505 [Monoraphidium minutum]
MAPAFLGAVQPRRHPPAGPLARPRARAPCVCACGRRPGGARPLHHCHTKQAPALWPSGSCRLRTRRARLPKGSARRALDGAPLALAVAPASLRRQRAAATRRAELPALPNTQRPRNRRAPLAAFLRHCTCGFLGPATCPVRRPHVCVGAPAASPGSRACPFRARACSLGLPAHHSTTVSPSLAAHGCPCDTLTHGCTRTLPAPRGCHRACGLGAVAAAGACCNSPYLLRRLCLPGPPYIGMHAAAHVAMHVRGAAARAAPPGFSPSLFRRSI